MSYDRAQFLNSVTDLAKKRREEAIPNLRAAQAVAPVMEKLMTGNGSWDRYLQHVQSFKLQAEAAKNRAENRQRDPMVWDHESMSKLKADIIAADAMMEAFTLCMELPKLLIENAEIATQTIARFEAGNDKATGQTQP